VEDNKKIIHTIFQIHIEITMSWNLYHVFINVIENNAFIIVENFRFQLISLIFG